ncbi:MAG: T9SS type A sorting domain-containing protein [Bacteroidota bacterium]
MAFLLTLLTVSYILHLSTMKHLSSFLLGFCLLLVSICFGQGTLDLGPGIIIDPGDPVVFDPPCTPAISSRYSVPVNDEVRDQHAQGPCYIFATIAALESRAIQSCMDIRSGFHEWSLYNTCVLGGKVPGAGNMIRKVTDIALNEGLLNRDHYPIPGTNLAIPNRNDIQLPGIGDYACEPNCDSNDRVYAFSIRDSGTFCSDKNGNNNDQDDNPYPVSSFELFNPIIGDIRYSLVGSSNTLYYPANLPASTNIDTGLEFVDLEGTGVTEEDKVDVLLHLLSQGYGCISLFDDFRDGYNHCIFIYGGDGCDWDYKDSWPGDARLESGSLDLSKLTGVYYFTGYIQKKVPGENKLICDNFAIEGDEGYPSITTFKVTGTNNLVCDYYWETVGGGTIISGQGTEEITFQATNCTSNNSIILKVTLSSPGGSCSLEKVIEVPQTPSNIFVQSPYWDGSTQTACPDEIFVANTTELIGEYYSWQITGGDILGSPNGNDVQFRSHDVASGPLTIRVRAGNICGLSPFFDLNGQINASGSSCGGGNGGGGQFRTAPSTVTVQDRVIHWSGYGISYTQRQEGITCTLVNLNGKEVFRQRLIDVEQRLDVRHLASGLYILSIKGAEFHQREKVFLR